MAFNPDYYKYQTAKEHKIVLMTYVIWKMNNAHLHYTAKHMFNSCNKIYEKHGYKKVSYTTYKKYMLLLKQLSLVTCYIEKNTNVGTKIYYNLTKSPKQCAEILNDYLPKVKSEAFHERKLAFYSKKGLSEGSVGRVCRKGPCILDNVLDNIELNNIIIDEHILNIVKVCKFEDQIKKEILMEIENDMKKSQLLPDSIKRGIAIEHDRAVLKWLEKSTIKENPLAILISKLRINKDIRIKMLNELQSQLKSIKPLTNKKVSTKVGIERKDLSTEGTLSFRPLPTEKDLDNTIELLRKAFLSTVGSHCTYNESSLNYRLKQIKQKYNTPETMKYLINKNIYTNFAEALDSLKKNIEVYDPIAMLASNRMGISQEIKRYMNQYHPEITKEHLDKLITSYLDNQQSKLSKFDAQRHYVAFKKSITQKLETTPTMSMENVELNSQDWLQFDK